MFPRISDLFYVWFGWDFILPIQSFGFMVAICFIVAYYVINSELRRKQKQGIFPTKMVRVKKGGPIPATDILIQFLIFGLVGYKLGLMFEDYQGFANDTQAAIMSTRGSMMYALIFGVLAAGWQLYLYNKRKNDKPVVVKEEQGILNEMGVIMTIAFIGGILGAKFFHNLEYWDQFIQDPIRSLFSFDGLTFYGGLIVAGLGIAWYVRKKGYKVLGFADAVAPALMLGYGIGRIGCQLAGDGDWGIANTAPKPGWLSWAPDWSWAFTFPHNVIKEGVRMTECDPHWGEYCNQLATPVYPTPFYETLMAVGLFLILWALRKRLPYLGQMFGIYLVANGLERFFIEKIRVNATYQIFGSEITQAEIISTLLVLGGIVLFSLATYKWKYQALNPNPEPEPVS